MKTIAENVPRTLVPSFEVQNPSSLKKPLRQTSLRWVALILINVLILGDFMALEGPQPIETQIKEILGINEEQYSILYSSWALPSILSPLFGGYLIDRFGIRSTLLSFSLLVTLGQFIYAYGGIVLSFSWMIVGRTIYALGTDPLNVVQIVLINKWFNGKELAFALSLSGSTFGIGRALNSSLTPILFNISNKLETPMLFGALLCFVGTLIALLMVKWDAEDEKREIAINPAYNSLHQETEKISLSDIKHFNRTVWLLILNFGLIFGVSFSFNAFTNDLYHTRYQFTNVQAGNIISTNFIVMAISAAIFGKYIDHKGKRTALLMGSSIAGVSGFLYFFAFPRGIKNFSMVIPQILFGIQLGIGEAVICPGLPLVLKEKYLGTGYGLFFVIENILVLVLPPVAATIKDLTVTKESDGYSGMLLFFFAWTCLMVFTSIKLFVEDRKKGRVLEQVGVTHVELKEDMILVSQEPTTAHSIDSDDHEFDI